MDGTMSRTLTIATLTTLAALNAVLVPAALWPPTGEEATTTSPWSATPSDPWPTTPATTDPSPAPDVATEREALRPHHGRDSDSATQLLAELAEPPLDLAAGQVALRAAPGACGAERARLERSVNGGRTWQALTTPAWAILRIRVVGRQSAWLVGADRACRLRFYRTRDGGRRWTVSAQTNGAWHRLPDRQARRLHAPTGLVASPCPADGRIVEVVGVTLWTGAVLCGDGSVYRTGDGGRSWPARSRLSGARALAFASPETGYAAVEADTSCSGIQVQRSTDGGARWAPVGCLRDIPGDGTRRAAVSLDFADSATGLLVAGPATFRTSDKGRTWSRVGAPAKSLGARSIERVRPATGHSGSVGSRR